jgi:hypothetical protein
MRDSFVINSKREWYFHGDEKDGYPSSSLERCHRVGSIETNPGPPPQKTTNLYVKLVGVKTLSTEVP